MSCMVVHVRVYGPFMPMYALCCCLLEFKLVLSSYMLIVCVMHVFERLDACFGCWKVWEACLCMKLSSG